MQLCPSPACPFRVRHGFAAEFEDHVERCRSCDGPLEQAAAAVDNALAWPGLARLCVTAVLVAALAGFATLLVPGFQAPDELRLTLGSDLVDTLGGALSFGELSLRPALSWLVLGAILVEFIALAFPAGRALRDDPAGRRKLQVFALLLALGGLVFKGWMSHRALVEFSPALFAIDVGVPSASLVILTHAAGLPLLLTLAFVNERWGLGHGISIALGALLVLELATALPANADLPRQLIVTFALLGAALVLLGRPARATAHGRRPLGQDPTHAPELGLGLVIPTSGLVAIHALYLGPLTISAVGQQLLAPTLDPEGIAALTRWLHLALVLGLTALFAWVFTRPQLLTQRWRRAFPRADPAILAREAQAIFRRGLLRSGLLTLAIVLLGREQLPALEVTILAAILLDLAHELRLRLREPELVPLATQLDVPGANALAAALALEHKPAVVQALHHRALYHLFGWWLPTRVLVRPRDLESARTLRDQIIARPESSAARSTQAF
ncbi:hypothetical protein ENSA5_33970 [Enhygromyxa salina]|uniref:Uncharacterized protein n=1 Tax=Enhygromyxa salina TaxID=215803 RepID=A0A2S9XXD8_9BACT|nr:hypothetical protein [Enhygromyxa salina]PRP97504.1 hypothetical protein ENSA5_33970 [Enhygromyxa salina]